MDWKTHGEMPRQLETAAPVGDNSGEVAFGGIVHDTSFPLTTRSALTAEPQAYIAEGSDGRQGDPPEITDAGTSPIERADDAPGASAETAASAKVVRGVGDVVVREATGSSGLASAEAADVGRPPEAPEEAVDGPEAPEGETQPAERHVREPEGTAHLSSHSPVSVAKSELRHLDATLRQAQGIDLAAAVSGHLTKSQQAVLPDLLSGRSLTAIGKERGVTPQTLSVQVHEILARVVDVEAVSPHVREGLRAAVEAAGRHVRANQRDNPHLDTIREAKAAAAEASGEPSRRWGLGQPGKVVRELHGRGFDVAAHIPDTLPHTRDVARMLAAGKPSKDIATELGLSPARVTQLSGEIIDMMHYVVPRAELPPDLPEGFFNPNGSVIAKVDEQSVGGRLNKMLHDSGLSVSDAAERLGMSKAALYNLFGNRSFPNPSIVKRFVRFTGNDPEAIMRDFQDAALSRRLRKDRQDTDPEGV